MEFQYITEAMRPKILEIAHDIHADPELSQQEYATTDRIKTVLSKLNIDLLDIQPPTGVLAIIRGNRPGKTLALRADIDGLPVVEDPNHRVCSRTEGVMHACGHDIHTAALLGAAMALKNADFPGNILLIFQPAEELSTGARTVMDTGVFKSYPPDAFYSLHVMPSIPEGMVGIREGAIMAAQKGFSIQIAGKGGHGASPHLTKDPVLAATRTIDGLQTIASRQMDPISPFVLSVCSIHGGNAFNIIPDTVELTGTCRLLDNTISKSVEQWITDIAEKTALVHGCQAQTTFFRRLPALDNDPQLAGIAYKVAAELYGEEHILRQDTMMGSEDFSLYAQVAPVFMFHMGCAHADGPSYPLHNTHFLVSDRVTLHSAELLARTAIRYLETEI